MSYFIAGYIFAGFVFIEQENKAESNTLFSTFTRPICKPASLFPYLVENL